MLKSNQNEKYHKNVIQLEKKTTKTNKQRPHREVVWSANARKLTKLRDKIPGWIRVKPPFGVRLVQSIGVGASWFLDFLDILDDHVVQQHVMVPEF